MGSFRGDELEQEDFTNGLEEHYRRLDEVERFGEWAGCRSVTRADENFDFAENDSERAKEVHGRGLARGGSFPPSPAPLTDQEETT